MLQLEATSILDVPLVRQQDHSKECGLACVEMILKFHGVACSSDELRSKISVNDTWGTAMPQLGLYLINRGFYVEIVIMQPALFDSGSECTFLEQKDLRDYMEAAKGGQCSIQKGLTLNFFVEFMKAGGVVTPRFPESNDIREEIGVGHPLITSLSHRALFTGTEQPRPSGHYNVITGIDDRFIYVNDPDWQKPYGGQHDHKIERFMAAIFMNTLTSIDNGSIMKIKKTG